MKALTDFLTTDYGLLTAAVIAFTLGMGIFLTRFFVSHMKEDEQRLRSHG
jgi:uncharacterized membrane-anchored protein